MSDALYGFATGFADGFTKSYSARLANEANEKKDKIRFGAQAWLRKEERYNAAKQADEKLMSQAEALVSSQSLIPNDAVGDVFNMLQGGMTTSQILSDVRTSGAKFDLLPKPSESALSMDGSVAQTDDILGSSNEEVTVGEPIANTVVDVDGAKPEADPNNPFTQYSAEIQGAVGQEDGDYFNQVIGGYSTKARQNKYKFTPGLTKTDIPSLDEALAQNLYASTEFKSADGAGQQALILAAIQSKFKDDTADNDLPFGTGGVGASMTVWAMTDDGKAAIESGNALEIAKQVKIFTDIINPTVASESGKPKKDFDIADLEGSFLNIWERSEAGMKALENGDTQAILEAVSASHENAKLTRDSLNKGYGFDPETIKELKDIPGARESYKDYPMVLTQLSNIETALQEQAKEARVNNLTSKAHSVYGMVDGKLAFIGTGNRRGGKLYMPDPADPTKEKEVPFADSSQMVISSSDNPIDVNKWAASDVIKKRNTLWGTVDFASSALTYVAGLESNPLARTRVARYTSGASELLDELNAIRDISTIINKEGEKVLDRDKMLAEINGNVALSNFSAGVRSLMAQETSLIFDVARAEGNSGQALSNKDYDNYFRSIFNSTKPEVVIANIQRKVGQSFSAGLAGAESIAQSPGMQYALMGDGGKWWSSPKETVLAGRSTPLVNFINSSVDRISAIQENSSFATTPEQKMNAYIGGESVTVDQDMVDAYPQLQSMLGKTITAPEKK